MQAFHKVACDSAIEATLPMWLCVFACFCTVTCYLCALPYLSCPSLKSVWPRSTPMEVDGAVWCCSICICPASLPGVLYLLLPALRCPVKGLVLIGFSVLLYTQCLTLCIEQQFCVAFSFRPCMTTGRAVLLWVQNAPVTCCCSLSYFCLNARRFAHYYEMWSTTVHHALLCNSVLSQLQRCYLGYSW